MHSFMALALALFSLQSILCVQAALYVIAPASGSTCHGGEECTVQWLDDGQAPLLSSFGVCSVGLYTGDNQLVQTIEPLDVSTSHSLTFTPIPEAGPNSDTYYISFISAANETIREYSPFFQLDQMSGSFSSALDSATASIPVPSATTTSDNTDTTLPTITVGTLSTVLPPISTLSATTPLSTFSPLSSSSSRLTTSVSRSSAASASTGSSTASAAPSESSNSASSRTNTLSPTTLGVLSFCLLVVSLF